MKTTRVMFINRNDDGNYSSEASDLELMRFPATIEHDGLVFAKDHDIWVGEGSDREFAGTVYLAPNGKTFTIFND